MMTKRLREDNSMDRPRCVRRLTGFTLIEVMLVVVLLGILSGMIAFRMTGDIRRRRDLFALKIASLLETLAHRHQLSQDRMALSFDPVDQSLQLERFALDGEANLDEDRDWRRDLLAPRVVMSDDEILISSIRFDGQTLALNDYVRWEISIGEARPTIEIEMIWGDQIDLIQLLPHELCPTRYGLGEDGSSAMLLEPVDLDAIGKDDESW